MFRDATWGQIDITMQERESNQNTYTDKAHNRIEWIIFVKFNV